MTISEVPLDTLNRFAAEKLGHDFGVCGWKLPSPSVTHDHMCVEPTRHTRTSGVMDWETPHRCKCGCIWDSHPYECVEHDFTQPAGMKMLLERIIDKNGSVQNWSRIRARVDWDKVELGRATLEVFCEMEGFQVEEA